MTEHVVLNSLDDLNRSCRVYEIISADFDS